jgi:hypothetical protein
MGCRSTPLPLTPGPSPARGEGGSHGSAGASPSRDIFAVLRHLRFREIANPLLGSKLQHREVVFDGQVEVVGRQFQRTALV